MRAYHHPVILSFGHEMNAPWYSWGYLHTSPAAFVSAWRHIVTTVPPARAPRNVTWLWTVNVIQSQDGQTLRPAAWWPGQHVRDLGGGRRLLPQAVLEVRGHIRADHRRAARADQGSDSHRRDERDAGRRPAGKIADLFAGIHAYGLLGFVWFNASTSHDYRMAEPQATAAFGRDAQVYRRVAS